MIIKFIQIISNSSFFFLAKGATKSWKNKIVRKKLKGKAVRIADVLEPSQAITALTKERNRRVCRSEMS